VGLVARPILRQGYPKTARNYDKERDADERRRGEDGGDNIEDLM